MEQDFYEWEKQQRYDELKVEEMLKPKFKKPVFYPPDDVRDNPSELERLGQF
jgi:hypothetical protein